MSSPDHALEALKSIKEDFQNFCAKHGAVTEADTRAKVVDRILKEVCDWPENAFERETHVGRGYTDYILTLRNKRYIAVEAKREGIPFTLPFDLTHKSLKLSGAILTTSEIREAIKQVRGYCDDFGIRYGIATNGYAWIVFRAIREDMPWREGSATVFPSLEDIINNFTLFWNLLSFEAINAGSLENEFGVLLRPTRQLIRIVDRLFNADLPLQRNRLHAQLHPLIRTVFEDIAEQDHLEILQSCYVHSKSLEIVAHDLNCVITDAIPSFLKHEGTEQLSSGRFDAGSFGTAVAKAFRADKGQLFLLLGGIGSGKSTFLKRYQKAVGSELLEESAFWFYVDFLEAPLDASALEHFVWSAVLEQTRARYRNNDLETRTNIKRAFRDQIDVLTETSLKYIQRDSKAYEKELSPYLERWQQNTMDYVPRLLRVSTAQHEKRAVLFIDNVDQLTPAYQAQIFLLAQRVTRVIGAITIVALREESYYAASIQKTFSAYTNRKFHIASPHFKRLIGSRIKFAKALLEGDSKAYNSIMSSGIHIDKESIAEFLEIVEHSIFDKTRYISQFVEAICFGNMRSALQMFTTFLVSGATDVDKMLYIYRRDGGYFVAFHEFVKSVMLGERSYYKESQSPIMNIFDCGSQKHSSHFTALRILKLLLSHRGESTDEGQGYYEIGKALSLFEDTFDNREDFLRSMNRLVNRQLVEVNTKSLENIAGASHVRVTSAGWYYVRHLVSSFAYLDLVLQDTPFNNPDTERHLRESVHSVNNLGDKEDQKLERIKIRFDRVEKFLQYLQEEENEEIKYYGLQRQDSILADSQVGEISVSFAKQRAWIQRRLQENRERYAEEAFSAGFEEEMARIMSEHYEPEVVDEITFDDPPAP